MYKIFLLAIALASPSAFAGPPPVDNTLPPCDSSVSGPKPPCTMDSESIRVPPKTPNEGERIIVPPEDPVKGLPERPPQPGGDIVDDPRSGNNDGTFR